MTTTNTTGTVRCDHCGNEHRAEYSHEGQYGEGAVYAVVCPADDLTDYYTTERVAFAKPTPRRRSLTVAAALAVRGVPRRCGATVVKDGQPQMCDRPVDEHGYCDRPSDHTD